MLTEKQFNRLTDSITWSLRQFEYPRTKYHEAINLSSGKHYMLGGAEKVQPFDFIKLAEMIYVRLLAPQSPRAMFSTANRQLRPTAANFELAVNQIPAEIGFDATLADAVLEAIYAPYGVVKVGLHTVTQILGHDYGAPFADLLTFDDYFCDMSAKREDLMQYEGNDYWVPYEEFMDSDWGEKKAKRDLKPDEYTLVSPEGNDTAQSTSADSTPQLFKDKVLLRDVWLPSEREMLTYLVTQKKMVNQAEMDDDAPEHGPYHKLGFCRVAGGNVLPMPPVALWRDIHELANSLYRKMADGAMGQKRVQGFSDADEAEIRAYRDAKDGDGIRYTGRKPETLDSAGVDPKTIAFFLQAKDLGSWVAGNLDSLGGLSAMADTVGQEKLLSEASGAMLRGMGHSVIAFVKDIYRSLAKYEWDDPANERDLEKPIPGTQMTIPVKWDKSSRKGSFDEYDLDIDIYSLQDNTPSLRLQKLGMFVEKFVIPLYPLIQKQGGSFNAKRIIDEAVRCMGVQEFDDIVEFIDQEPEAGKEQGPGKPANTTRTYDRVSRPGATAQGKNRVMMESLLGGNPQGSEMASLARGNE